MDIEALDLRNGPGGSCLPAVSQSSKAGVDWILIGFGPSSKGAACSTERIVSVGLRSSQSPASRLKCCLFSCFCDLTATRASFPAMSWPGEETKAEFNLCQLLLVLNWQPVAWQRAVVIARTFEQGCWHLSLTYVLGTPWICVME